MGKKLYELTFVIGVSAALSLGIFLKTGQSIDVISISSKLFDLIKNTFGDPNGVLTNSNNLLGILGITLTLCDIIGIIIWGWIGIISAILGYTGMLILVMTDQQLIGAILLIIGGSLALLKPDST